ncbi:MAG: transglycosylase SLT domain-containing protein [Acidobacteria bacterium]|nr:transglycosylase SLT domain-containing protein [Acidobacteriota bacterium]
MTRRIASTVTSLVLAALFFSSASVRPARSQDRAALPAVALEPTAHAPIPRDPGALWLAPGGEAGRTGQAGALLKVAQGIERFNEQRFADALPLLRAAGVAGSPLADYAVYYAGLAELRLNDVTAARRTLSALKDRPLEGYLAYASVLARGEAAELDNDHAAASALYEQLAAGRPLEPEVVVHRLGRAALAAGDKQKAVSSFLRLRYEFPLSDEAALADVELERLSGVEPRPNSPATVKQEFARAEQLFASRRYAQAREAFQSIRQLASGEERDLADLRVAESDFYLRRYASARDGLRGFLAAGGREAEAQFFHLAAIRELGQHEEYLSRVRALVDAHPGSSWAEEALNNLGTHHILQNEDAEAAEAFRELLRRFPKGSRAERAAWKVGWWEYKNGNYAETVRIFESAAATFSRSDYRPSWVYWAARSRERIGDPARAAARYRLVTADYLNSYYGRLAVRRLEGIDKVARAAWAAPAAPRQEADVAVALPPTADRIRLLLSLGLELDALNELRYAQRQWGTSPALDATIAWVYHRQGDLRRAINQMKRAYPQHLSAAGGAALPDELLRVIFPLDYWPAIQKHSRARRLDPYLVAALIAQESTFDPEIRSAANAYGLMQVVPGTGRRLARSLGIRYRGVGTLTSADTNVRMGTLYFSRLVEQFGGVHLALAAYNAGENRVVRWLAERPGLERDEFIDDIPFPETQNYVKKILGTAEDYRLLYGGKAAEQGQRPKAQSGKRR